jgi:hypothetical protein
VCECVSVSESKSFSLHSVFDYQPSGNRESRTAQDAPKPAYNTALRMKKFETKTN